MSKFNWEKTKKENRIFLINKTGIDHFCPGCDNPLRSIIPYCNSCFLKGLYPKNKWKNKEKYRDSFSTPQCNDGLPVNL